MRCPANDLQSQKVSMVNRLLIRSTQASAVCLLTASLLGCASQTEFVAPTVQVPEGWKQGAASAAATDEAQATPWWQDLNDPVLNQLIETAQARNLNLAQAAIKVRRAQLVSGQASSDQLPSLSVKGSSTVSRPLDGGSTTRLHSVTGGVNWEVDLWGRLAAAKSAAEWEAQATEQDRQAAALSLSATVANLYWQIAYLNQRVDASQQSMGYAARTLKLVQAQYSAGDVSGLEVAQATQTLAAQQASHTQWLQQRVQARNALAILLDATPDVAASESPRLSEAALPKVQAGLPASLLTRRPDLRAAQLRLRKSLASVDVTRNSYYPSLTLTGSVGGSSNELRQVLSDPIATLGVGLVLPFVQWRDMQRSVAISQADYEVAVLDYRQTWYQALADVENALSAGQQFDEQGQRLQQAYAAAKEAERLSEVRYRAGAVPLKTWLDAQESRRQAENNLAQNRLNQLNAWVTVRQTLGG